MKQLFFYILKGTHKGYKFAVKKNLTIGKEAAQVNLNDPKLSKIHAQVVVLNENYYLEDSNSKHGLWIKDKRIKKVELHHGLQISLGDCLLEVRDKSLIVKKEKITPPPVNYFKLVSALASKLSQTAVNKKRKVSPLNPPLSLNFIRGIQLDTVWNLGYGPRKAGASSLDLAIFEPNAPNDCFQISSSLKGNLFTTPVPEKVRINKEAKDSIVLKDGDIIFIDNTKIKVGFIK